MDFLTVSLMRMPAYSGEFFFQSQPEIVTQIGASDIFIVNKFVDSAR